MSTTKIPRFKIGDKVYTTAGLDELTLKDVLLFESEAKDAGFDLTYADLEQLAFEIGKLTDAQAQKHPKGLLLTAVTLWASRKKAGEKITFDEAISIPIDSITFLDPTEDRARPTQARKGVAKKTPAAKKKATTAARSASAQRARAAGPASAAAKTSASQSARA